MFNKKNVHLIHALVLTDWTSNSFSILIHLSLKLTL